MTKSTSIQSNYGKLTVLRISGMTEQPKRLVWLCQCECGNKIHLPGVALQTNCIKSCGCEEQEIQRLRRLLAQPPTFTTQLLRFLGLKNDHLSSTNRQPEGEDHK